MRESGAEGVPYGWSEDRQGFSFIIRPVSELIQRYVGSPCSIRILDLGCGNGTLCEALKRWAMMLQALKLMRAAPTLVMRHL